MWTIIVYILGWIKSFFVTKNFTIKKVDLEYHTSKELVYPGDHFFWTSEWRKEIGANEYIATDVTWQYKQGFLPLIIHEAPEMVCNFKIRVTYIYNKQKYKYITKNPQFKWPPKKVPGFNPKIKKATVLYKGNGKVCGDYTKCINKYAGPFNDFCGDYISLHDMFIPDENIELVNMFDKTTVITDGFFCRQDLWGQSS